MVLLYADASASKKEMASVAVERRRFGSAERTQLSSRIEAVITRRKEAL